VFPPIFPIYIPALAPLHPYAPLVWLGGVVGLWLTRYTHQLGRRWGAGYYIVSALIRPVGVVLLAAGWLALYAPTVLAGSRLFGRPVGWLPRGNAWDVVWWAGVVLSCALDVWAILALGLRRSFLFRHVEDRLVTSGPYALVRHPQFLSTIALTFCSIRLFDPFAVPWGMLGGAVFYRSLNANWVLLALALWLLSILEERELVAHFGEAYRAYARRVPRLWPTFPAQRAALRVHLGDWCRTHRRGAEGAEVSCHCEEAAGAADEAIPNPRLGDCFAPLAMTLQLCASAVLLPGRLLQQVTLRWGRPFYALARLGELGLAAVACGTVVVAGRQLMLLWGGPLALLRDNQWADILCWLGTAGFLALGGWAIATAGLRRTLCFWRPPEPPPLGGPFALVRHPLLLAAVGVTLLATRPFEPWPFAVTVLGRDYPFGAHWLPYTLLAWLLALLEDWLAGGKLGEAVEGNASRLPRLIPN